MTALGNSDEITQTMKAHVVLGNRLGLSATPSFIIGGVAILGYPGRDTLQGVVDAWHLRQGHLLNGPGHS